jgi:hypothetical protein
MTRSIEPHLVIGSRHLLTGRPEVARAGEAGGARRVSGVNRAVLERWKQPSLRAPLLAGTGREAETEAARYLGDHIPGKPPRPFMASIWRIIFFAPPPFIIFIIFCICWNCFSS